MRKFFWTVNLILVLIFVTAILASFVRTRFQTKPKEVASIATETVDTRTIAPTHQSTDEKKEEVKPTPTRNQLVVTQAPTKPPSKKAKVAFVGDVCLQTATINAYEKGGIGGLVCKELLGQLKQADIAMANQEFTFSTRGEPMEDKQYTFEADPKYVRVFQQLGLDVVSLANNHALDYGIDALRDSFTTLDEEGISYVGAGETLARAKQIEYKSVNGINIAFLAASRVIPVPDWNATRHKPGMLTTYDPTILIEQIQLAKSNADVVVVYVHWGIEREDMPKSYQRALAKQYIDAGASLIVGSHPHCMQGIEFYKGKPIVYSLGNFIFNRTIKQTALLEVEWDETLIPVLTLTPCFASNAYTNLLSNPKEKQSFYEYMTQISIGVTVDNNGKVLQNY